MCKNTFFLSIPKNFVLLQINMDKKPPIIGGCNGAGKTTASYTVLPDILQCREFVNADGIAHKMKDYVE